MPRKGLNPKPRVDGGMPAVRFDDAQVDFASLAVGQCQFSSRAVDRIVQKYPDLSRDLAFELLRVARARVFAEMRSRGEDDPLTAVYLFLKSVIADEQADTRNRLAAANQIVRLFGLERLAKAIEGAGGVEEFLAAVLARRMSNPNNPKESNP